MAAGSSSSLKPPPPLAAGSSSPKPPSPNFTHLPYCEELIVSYLRPRVVSDTKVGFIHEVDLYSADPYQLTANHSATTASSRETAWFFFTPLHRNPRGSGMKRSVDTGRKGAWVKAGSACVKDVLSNGQRIGQRRGFAFQEKIGDNLVKSAWRMMELRLNPIPNEERSMAGSSDLLALCKVYRTRSTRNSKAEDWSSMAAAKADAEAPTSSVAATSGREGADEEIGADTAAGPVSKKRKAGHKDSGAETVAPSPGRQKKADGEIESADAATTGEIFADKDPSGGSRTGAQGTHVLRFVPRFVEPKEQ